MKKVCNFGIIVIISMVFVFMTSLQVFAATTADVLDGQVSITDSVGNGSGDATKYTATVTGNLLSTKASTIEITNETQNTGVIKFNYSVSNQKAFTIDNVAVDTAGEYSAILNSGEKIIIVLTAPAGKKKATLTLTDVTFEIATGFEVTFEFDNTLGTITVDGTTIESGEKKEVSAGKTIEIIATPVDDAVFAGWIDADTNEIISLDTTYTYKPNDNKTIRALFSKNTPYFMVDEKYIYDDLNKAVQMGSTVVLLCNGTLTAGNYTIPAGVTLLIPFDDANTLYTNKPAKEDIAATEKTLSVYRTLKLEKGANVIVNGAISVSAKHSYKQGSNGSPVGAYGHIAMEDGSTITVNSGANLYAWGYITGFGSVVAKPGAVIYECFQARDYRGGDATSGMKDNKQRVFPMSQYYVQNIEVPLTLEAGAVEKGYMSVHAPIVDPQSSEVPFIGESGMFNITSGYIIKDYDEETDRLKIDVNGTLAMQALKISMNVTGLIPTTINSANYTLPINGNITLNVNSGSTVNISQEMALLPGGEINVYKDATCTFSSGAKVFIYDAKEWGNYTSHQNKSILAVNYSPTRQKTRTEADLVDAKVFIEGTVDASNGFVYTTASGADVQGADGGLVKISLGTDTVTYQATQSADGNGNQVLTYTPIDIATAWLKNEDDTYTKPAEPEDKSCLSSYSYLNGKWSPNHSFSEEWTVDIEPTCTTAGSKSRHCVNCADVKTDITEIASLGHDMSEATCDTPAICSICGHIEGTALGHATINHEAKAPTCEAIGWDAYETCSRCDYSTYVEKSALGHSYGDWESVDELTHKRVCSTDETHEETGEHTFVDNVCSECRYEKAVPTIGETSGWEDIKDTISTPQEEIFIVEMNGTKEVPVEVFETIAGNDNTVEFNVKSGISWTVKGEEVPEAVDIEKINLNVELNVDTIPVEVVETVDADEKIQVELEHNGEFGFTMYLNIEFGAEKAGKWANLYYFNTEDKSLELQETVKIDENGIARFTFNHASNYLATINEVATVTKYNIADEKIAISTKLNFEVPADAQIMIATYNSNGGLLNMALRTASTIGEGAEFPSKDVAEIKVFVWDGFDSMKPVSIPEQVPVTANSN